MTVGGRPTHYIVDIGLQLSSKAPFTLPDPTQLDSRVESDRAV